MIRHLTILFAVLSSIASANERPNFIIIFTTDQGYGVATTGDDAKREMDLMQTAPGEFTRIEGTWYVATLAELFQNPGCIGFHLCGAYQRNKARRYGLLDEQEKLDEENVALINAANQRITDRMAKELSAL